jgi:CxxC-x17-CxxC domain-containing protein
MDYTDRTLTCSDCGTFFVFNVREQEYCASRGFHSVPLRCPRCRAIRRRQRLDRGNNQTHGRRPMHHALCASCGRDCEVPFEPVSGRPMYCSGCYSPARRYRRHNGSRSEVEL